MSLLSTRDLYETFLAKPPLSLHLLHTPPAQGQRGPDKFLIPTCWQWCNSVWIFPLKPGKNIFFLICCRVADRAQKQICQSAPGHRQRPLFCIFTAERQGFEGRKAVSCSCLFSSTAVQRKVHEGREKYFRANMIPIQFGFFRAAGWNTKLHLSRCWASLFSPRTDRQEKALNKVFLSRTSVALIYMLFNRDMWVHLLPNPSNQMLKQRCASHRAHWGFAQCSEHWKPNEMLVTPSSVVQLHWRNTGSLFNF